ncbi:MAG: ABC transporter permease [Caldilineaceae bacterium]
MIDLPPGDYLTSYVASLRDARGSEIDQAEIEGLKQQYGLDQSLLVRYGKWMRNMLNGNFGRSFAWNREVSDLIRERLWITLLTAVLTLVVTYAVAIPIGIYSATRQYSIGDYFFTIIGFMGLAMPTFFLALVLMYYINRATGFSVGGLYSPEYMNQPMNTAKFIDMLKHISILVIAVGMAGTASVIRIMRSGILDELQKPYVIAARSKGLTEIQLLLRYPVRLALNPIVSTIGWILPSIVSGATVTAIVMNIPTIGAALCSAAGPGYLRRGGVDHAALVYDCGRHVHLRPAAGRG